MRESTGISPSLKVKAVAAKGLHTRYCRTQDDTSQWHPAQGDHQIRVQDYPFIQSNNKEVGQGATRNTRTTEGATRIAGRAGACSRIWPRRASLVQLVQLAKLNGGQGPVSRIFSPSFLICNCKASSSSPSGAN